MYRNLDSAKTVQTIRKLRSRIGERFPDSSLGRVCQELVEVAEASRQRAEWIGRPQILLRVATGGIITAALVILIYAVSLLELHIEPEFDDFAALSDSALNCAISIAAAVFFLVTIESRIKRKRALTALDELRAIAHVIDMHQLTKDPVRILTGTGGTPSSPSRRLTPFELTRYLDYCSEMLALTGKIAALYAQRFPDSVVLGAVNELEILTAGLSRKIWQKIMIVLGTNEEAAMVVAAERTGVPREEPAS